MLVTEFDSVWLLWSSFGHFTIFTNLRLCYWLLNFTVWSFDCTILQTLSSVLYLAKRYQDFSVGCCSVLELSKRICFSNSGVSLYIVAFFLAQRKTLFLQEHEHASSTHDLPCPHLVIFQYLAGIFGTCRDLNKSVTFTQYFFRNLLPSS